MRFALQPPSIFTAATDAQLLVRVLIRPPDAANEGRSVAISPLAGKPAPAQLLIDPSRLEKEYYECQPDVDEVEHLVSFGTSGHRGTTAKGTFAEAHILAITQAICDYRRGKAIDGPLYMGKTRIVSAPAAADGTGSARGEWNTRDHLCATMA